MVELNFKLDKVDHIGENWTDPDLVINIMLSGFKARKNISLKAIVKKINYTFLCEYFCMHGQFNQKDFLDRCNGGNKQEGCRIEKILDFINIYW